MNKTQLIDAIASGAKKTKTDSGPILDKSDIGKALDAIIRAIIEAINDGERVSIPGFGTFTVVERKARAGRNPRTGEKIQIPAKNVVKFRPSKNIFAPPIDPALLVDSKKRKFN